MICPTCGQELVEVDNPMRREVRHKRGVKCEPKERERDASTKVSKGQ